MLPNTSGAQNAIADQQRQDRLAAKRWKPIGFNNTAARNVTYLWWCGLGSQKMSGKHPSIAASRGVRLACGKQRRNEQNLSHVHLWLPHSSKIHMRCDDSPGWYPLGLVVFLPRRVCFMSCFLCAFFKTVFTLPVSGINHAVSVCFCLRCSFTCLRFVDVMLPVAFIQNLSSHSCICFLKKLLFLPTERS